MRIRIVGVDEEWAGYCCTYDVHVHTSACLFPEGEMENVTTLTAARLAGKIWGDVRPLFYLELPSTSSFQHVTEVPDYLKQVTPYFFAMILLEVFIRWMKGMPRVRFNDSINSLSAGLFLLLAKILLGGIDISLYVWVHSRFCVYELPWDSALTWIVALLGVDCGYYWFHRMAHEVNLFWAAHQTHHSSEDYTLSTALRQSTCQVFTSMVNGGRGRWGNWNLSLWTPLNTEHTFL
ncbi:Alkylglycerol monooxygenase [Geodia barretti]|uniref:Alkylglycerol monooxygenase n=1 Tax=Geodia barretti TaxID=519541 RepID=A0AA35XDF4_GEOBA|nr:Alkylglycerol monooxygenase [Geodia barretti]